MIEYFKKIYNDTAIEFYKLVNQNIKNDKKMFIITANPETLMIAEKNKELKNLLLSGKPTIIADGIGIVKGGKMLNFKIKERIPGIDLTIKLLEYCNDYKKHAYFFGSSEEVLTKFVSHIQEKYPNIKISGFKNGYDYNRDQVFSDILKTQPDIILVGLGIPFQELLIDKHYSKFKKGIFVGVGGSFDVISGDKKRAPKLFIRTNTEWLYRLITERGRLKRFYENNLKFFIKIITIANKK